MAGKNGWIRLQEVPEWRWLRAGECVTHKTKPKYSVDDEYVRKAYDFKLKYDKFNMRRVREASERWPDVFDALRLFQNNAGNGLRWIVEAAVIANREQD
jgi:hypothetical protein